MLLENGAEFVGDEYLSALTYACPSTIWPNRFLKKTIMFLLQQARPNRPNVNQYDPDGQTPFQSAVDRDDVEIVSYMLEHFEPELEKRELLHPTTIFHCVKSKGMFDLLTNCKKPNGKEALEKLIEKRNDVSGYTPLMSAASGNHLYVCKSLIESGAKVFAKRHSDNTYPCKVRETSEAYELASNPDVKNYLFAQEMLQRSVFRCLAALEKHAIERLQYN